MGSLWLSRTDKSTLRYVLVWICSMSENLVQDIYETPDPGAVVANGAGSSRERRFRCWCCSLRRRSQYLSPRRVYESSVQAGLAPGQADRFPTTHSGLPSSHQVLTTWQRNLTWLAGSWTFVPTFICANNTCICEISLERK